MNVNLMMLLAFGAGLFLLWVLSKLRNQPTRESFLVANRSVTYMTGAFILTANWVQAPALWVSGALWYQSTWHFLAFLLPNVCAMVLTGFIAAKLQRMMRQRGEKWYTIAQAMGAIYGPGARTMMLFCTLGALTVAVSYTLTGIREWLSPVTGVSSWQMSMLIGACALMLVAPSGLLGAIKADKFKVALIAGFALLLVLLVSTHGVDAKGPSIPASPMTPWQVFWFVGLPLGISLMGGPICNPDLAERVWAVNEKSVRNAYIWGGVLFGVAASVFGIFGPIARELGYKLAPGQLPMLTVLRDILPEQAVYVMSVPIVLILAAALASLLASAGDVFSIEVVNRWFLPKAGDRQTVNWSRFAMLIPIVAGTYITSFEKIDVRFLQESMAVVRGEAIFPVV